MTRSVVKFETHTSPRRSGCAKDRKSTRLNSSHMSISYAVFCLKKKKKRKTHPHSTNQTAGSAKLKSSTNIWTALRDSRASNSQDRLVARAQPHRAAELSYYGTR